MSFVRLTDGRIIDKSKNNYIVNDNDLILHEKYETVGGPSVKPGQMVVPAVAIIDQHNEYSLVGTISQEAENIEDLIQLGDLIFYWCQSDDTERVDLVVNEWDIIRVKGFPITRLLVKHGQDYKCVAAARHEFVISDGRRWLVKKGELCSYEVI